MNGNQVINDPLAVLYNESYWRISRVSPMHNLQYDELNFKQYATRIHMSIDWFAVKTSFKVVIEELELKYAEYDSNSLMITASSSEEENKGQILYNAILLSWGLFLTANNTVHLPYMLERGELKIGTEMKRCLQHIFDCTIKQYNFTQIQLLQFGFNFLEYDTSRNSDSFILKYKTPQANFNDKISLTFEVGDVRTIWNRIKDDSRTELELIQLAYRVLLHQVFYALTLNVNVFDLCEVLLPKSEVKSCGVVKMKTPEMVNTVFQILNKISNFS